LFLEAGTMKETNPPAIVAYADDLASLMDRCIALAGELKTGKKRNLALSVELGKALNLAEPQCKYGQWGKLLEKMEIPRTTAWECQTVAKLPARVIAKCSSTSEALASCSEPNKCAEDNKDDSTEALAPKKRTKKPSKPADPSANPPDCPRCAGLTDGQLAAARKPANGHAPPAAGSVPGVPLPFDRAAFDRSRGR
jgi:hypothetical protein